MSRWLWYATTIIRAPSISSEYIRAPVVYIKRVRFARRREKPVVMLQCAYMDVRADV